MSAPEVTAAVRRATARIFPKGTQNGLILGDVRDALAAALDVEEMARVIVAAMHPGAGYSPTKIDRRIATALRAAILGEES